MAVRFPHLVTGLSLQSLGIVLPCPPREGEERINHNFEKTYLYAHMHMGIEIYKHKSMSMRVNAGNETARYCM